MKLLVTGGLGFIGSNFILNTLVNHPEFEIMNVDAELFGSNHKSLESVKNNHNYKFVKGNITNKPLMEKLISDSDIVINFAAESFVDRSILDANSFLVSNIRGTYTILDIIKNQNKKLIHISTDEVFGSLESENANEFSKFNPSNPYAATKASAELIINSYNITYDTDCIITRCTNNYGPMQFPEKLIPKTIILASKNEKIPIYGNGKNIRDWIFVEDHCDAILKILHKGKSQQSYNISAHNSINNIEIVKKILSKMNCSFDLIEFVDDRPGHDLRYSLDSSKIRTDLDWSETTNFDDGLQKTIDWYMNNDYWWNEIKSDIFKSEPWKN
jgi:dTDP-glucose 4,6-dehydratase|tara:strand:+ start:569 stop:1555 length:987 start_codon:yes stop_codon:yes gene_type:complete